ncbi:hypothetical protein PPYR_14629 [Photinus pyralis]|uniref:Uncharacterized protein n=1 Tax=Photinus pyralis TaxID=7054 RepID=A0A5N4A5R6_PHOPY|nr:hypothetical protein PPYR_14629 [Photinus pyralis]
MYYDVTASVTTPLVYSCEILSLNFAFVDPINATFAIQIRFTSPFSATEVNFGYDRKRWALSWLWVEWRYIPGPTGRMAAHRTSRSTTETPRWAKEGPLNTPCPASSKPPQSVQASLSLFLILFPMAC